jgi:hypothetical protein
MLRGQIDRAPKTGWPPTSRRYTIGGTATDLDLRRCHFRLLPNQYYVKVVMVG